MSSVLGGINKSMEGIIMKCGKCGRELIGLNFGYGRTWDCSDCTTDKTSVLHCERGSKVIVKTLGAGYPHEQEEACRLFSVGDVFTINTVNVGRSSSEITLKEFPQKHFNTVFFERCC